MLPERQIPPEHRMPPFYLYEPEDEINLLDYLIVLLRHKWLILLMVVFAGVAAIIISLRMTNIYRSEATIIPRHEEKSPTSPALSVLRGLGGVADELVGLGGGGSVDKCEVVLKSRHLSRRIVDKYKLMPRLFEEEWDPKKKTWMANPTPTHQDAYIGLMDMLTVSRDRKTDVMTIKFDHKDPGFAKQMVDYYLTELSETLREETLRDAEENQRFLRKQLEQTSDVLMEEKIYAMLAREIEKETFARAQKYYSFLVLDPPIVSDLDKKEKPRRAIICILAVTVAFLVAVVLAFFLEYIHNATKKEDPETLSRPKKSAKLRSPKEF